jgi:hypothetical protein
VGHFLPYCAATIGSKEVTMRNNTLNVRLTKPELDRIRTIAEPKCISAAEAIRDLIKAAPLPKEDSNHA